MDFYIVLGLTQDASPADIKRAYRRLSRRFHPGINPGDRNAESMFRRISEAYETLNDPARRREYDASGSGPREADADARPSLQFAEFDFSRAASGAQAATFTELFAEILHPVAVREQNEERGADIHATVTTDFVGAVRGFERQIVVTRQAPCGVCRGRGELAVAHVRCIQCQGRGTVRWARGHMVFTKVCPACGGAGQQRVQRCTACAGSGRAVRGEGVTVRVPPGTSDGDRLRIAEAGHAGYHGGPNGDLYVTVNVHPHPFFGRDGDTLTCAIPLAVHEAVLGARIEVPTLDGPITLRIPPGTQAGQRFRIAGRGVPGPDGARGDLIVEVKLVLPASVDDRSRELMKEFGERNNEDVRRSLFEVRGDRERA